MARLLNKWKKDTRWGESARDYHWQYDEEPDYTWLKKLVVSALIFTVGYIAQISDTAIGKTVTGGIRYVLSVETDFSYIAERLAPYAPQGFNTMVLKRVQTTVSKPADPLLYMSKPVEGKILAPFGWWTHPVLKQEMMHEGINFEALPGTNVKAASSGKVKTITESAQFGKTLIIEHGQEIETLYGHLGEVLVNAGDMVSQGQVVAKSGKTGMTTGPILYFELREKGKPVDPLTRLKGDFPANLPNKEGK